MDFFRTSSFSHKINFERISGYCVTAKLKLSLVLRGSRLLLVDRLASTSTFTSTYNTSQNYGIFNITPIFLPQKNIFHWLYDVT